MICSKCGSKIEEGSLYCGKCGQEVQLVPDFTDLGEFINEETIMENLRKQEEEKRRQEEAKRQNKLREEEARKELQRQEEEKRLLEQRKREKEALKKEQQKKTKKTIAISIVVSILVVGLLGGLIYINIQNRKNTFEYQLKQSQKAFLDKQYDTALEYVEKALKIEERPDGYIMKSKILLEEEKTDEVVKTLNILISKYPDNEQGYRGLIQLYESQEDVMSIKALLDGDTDKKILELFKDYRTNPVDFSIVEGSYDREKELQLLSDTGTIYYTTDGSEPDSNSTKYTDPIELKDGDVVVKAIAINEKGIPSDVVKQEYKIKSPNPEAPMVSPSSGKFTQYTNITVRVPEGAKAYYEWNGTPTTKSKEYTKPVPMWSGSNKFSVIIVNEDGKESKATSMTYDLEIPQELEGESLEEYTDQPEVTNIEGEE